VILLESIADTENRSLLATEVNIAAKDLENAKPAHAVSLWRLSWRRKKKRMRRDFECWMFNFSPRLRDTFSRGLLRQRSLSPDAGRGADAERQGLTRTRGTGRAKRFLKESRLSPDIFGVSIVALTPSNIQTRVWISPSSPRALSSSTIWSAA